MWWLLSMPGCVMPWPGDTLVANPILGFLYPGPLAEEGWSASHAQAKDQVHDRLDLPAAYRQGVEPYEAAGALKQLMDERSNVIFTTRYDFASATQQAATDHPERLFFSCGGRVTGPNLASYDVRSYQALYLAGRLAAATSCTRRLGVLGAVPTPEGVRNINAFAMGAREIDPTILVEAHFIGQWSDPAEEIAVADAMIARGVDVLTHQTDDQALIEHIRDQVALCGVYPDAVESPVYTIGYGAPASCTLNARCLTSTTWNWAPLYTDLLTQVLEGTLDPRQIRFEGFERDPEASVIGFSERGEVVTEEQWSDLLDKRTAFADPANSQFPFVGPFQDNQGLVRAGQGELLPDEALERMCWFVDGVVSPEEGDLPAIVPEGCVGER